MEIIRSGINNGGRRGFPSKRRLYQSVAGKAELIIERLLELTHSTNDSVSVGACRILLDRILPALKTVEIKGDTEGPVRVNLIEDFLYKTPSNEQL